MDGLLMTPTCLETCGGKTFNILEPNPAAVSIEDIAAHLCKLNRFSGATYLPISVAQHSVLVSQLCEPEFALEALLHDAHETYLGDVTRPHKKAMEIIGILDRWVQYIEKPVIEAVRRALKIPVELSHACEKAIKDADNMACRVEARCFMRSGGKHWNWSNVPEPPPVPLSVLTPVAAETEFLITWKALTEPNE